MIDREATILDGYVKRKAAYYTSVKYPFASEQSIDTTGFESVYALGRMEGDIRLVHCAQRASLACRGLQPLWYYYGSDNRMMGESYWNLGYETQLGAWQHQEFLREYSSSSDQEFADSMRSTYGTYLAGWANINSGQIDTHPLNHGAASWLWQSEGGNVSWPWMKLCGRCWAWSGEADLGWDALRTACVNVVRDPVTGLFAYGGTASFDDQVYTIYPADGLYCRLTLFCLESLSLKIENAKYTRATITKDKRKIELQMQGLSDSKSDVVITVSNIAPGSYRLWAADEFVCMETLRADESVATFRLPAKYNNRTIMIDLALPLM